MLKYYILLLLVGCTLIQSNGQSKWKSLESLPSNRENRAIEYFPSAFTALSMDVTAMEYQLNLLTHSAQRNTDAQTMIELPLPDGRTINMITVSSPSMEKDLAAKYSSIQSFKAWSEDHQYIARFDISPYGLRASIITPQGEVYIDPLYKLNKEYYLSYYVKDNTEPRDAVPACGVEHNEPRSKDFKFDGLRNAPINLHVYRLAISCTGEWGKQRGTVELALADLNSSVNRLNQIFESQFASRMVLINENDKLIHLDPATDPFSKPSEGRSCMAQNTQVINEILGSSNKYDLGHVYTNNCTDVGGVAMLGSICQGNKGAGCSCYYSGLIYITVQVTSHEMGHQMSANHTFNNCTSDSQNAADNGFEPGGGSTIMAYGGLCQNNNFVNSNDDYYHNGSLEEIFSHLRSTEGGAYGCAEKVATSNNLPQATISTPQGTIIPIGTPFVLDGGGSDVDGDKLYFNWEEKDGSATLCPLGEPTGTCPLFRSVVPDTLPYRIFPRPLRLLAGQNTDDEILPTYTRELNFSLTARDKNPQGGMSTWETLKISASALAGPFKVTEPNNGGQYEAGSVINVSWDVANTDVAPISCSHVDIYLSRKSALHVSDPNLILLAGRVPNTGSAEVQMPATLGSDARILVKASNNIFFDISNFRFTIEKSTKPRAFVSVDKYYEKLCLPNSTTITIKSEAIEGYTGKLKYWTAAPPDGIATQLKTLESEVGVDNELLIHVDNYYKTGTYTLFYYIATESDTIEKRIELDVTSTDFSAVATLTPNNGEKDAELPTFTWTPSTNAISYQLEVSKNPSFANLEFSTNVADSFYRHFKTFDKKSVFYWRIKPINGCKEGEWLDTKSFGTLTQDCKKYVATGLPVNISGSGTPTIESKINVPTGSNISDVNVTKMKITHANFVDLTGTLIAPGGKEVKLWEKICPKSLNIEVLIDDQAPNVFSCSSTASGQYRPKEPLSNFNGQDATGAWTLKVADSSSGNSGKLEGFELEICASVSVENPVLVKDQLLTIQSTDIGAITADYLLAEDKNNKASELTYTVVKACKYGLLRLNGTALAIGGTFTQDDINNNRITYVYTAQVDLPVNDGFNYLVTDIEGGWFGVNTFNILVEKSTGTIDVVDASMISVSPNPTNGSIQIKLGQSALGYNKLNIYNAIGKLVISAHLLGQSDYIDLNEQNNGIYFMEFSNGFKSVVKKLVLAK